MKKNKKDHYSNLKEVDNPLSLKIQEEIVPPNLKMLRERYNKLIDPHDHISYFQTSLDLYGAINATKCPMFSATLKRVAQSWFDSFLDQSIDSFKQLHQVFVGHFTTYKR